MTTKKLQTLYPTIPIDALQQIHNTLAELTTLQIQVTLVQQKIDDRMEQPRCTGRISGRHCIHPTGQNCPYPRHLKENIDPKTRIRASIRKREAADIQRAIKNAQQIRELQIELQQIQRTLELNIWSLTSS